MRLCQKRYRHQIIEDPTQYFGPETVLPPSPNPMPLTVTESKIEKAWSVERNPGTMAQLLYDEEGHPTQFSIDYALFYDDKAEPYKTMTLGWDGQKYDWDPSSIRYVTYNGHRVPIGTRWTKDFSIATGLMLSEAQMDEQGLDKTDHERYPEYIYGTNEKYYILEPGHDYRIEEIVPEGEQSWVTYEFDFISPAYHPMLVDGKLKNVIFNKDGNIITGIKEISKDEWLASLKIENTLRGYICLDKVVVEQDGETPIPDDTTKFEYRIELHNSTDPGPFTVLGSHVPWYGINDLFYHDEGWNYYQAEVYNAPDPLDPNKSHYLTIKTESGEVYDARRTNSDGSGWDDESLIFDEDITGPTWVTYYDEENDQYITVKLYGNQMVHASDNYVWAELDISQNEYLSIANVPVGTTYIVTERDKPGYDFVGTAMPSAASLDGTTVSGAIVPDSDNHITYTNKIHSAAVVVKKVDENGKALPGATFTLKRTSGTDLGQSDYDGDGLTKPDAEEVDTDTGTYDFEALPDGQYSLVETSAPDGFTGMTGAITFTVSGGRIQNSSVVKPTGVEWDNSNFTFTVKNTPIVNGITVRKQWLDYFGDADAPGAEEITLKVKRRVRPVIGKKLKVAVNAETSRGYIHLEKEILIQNTAYTVSWNDNGEFQWVGDRLKRNDSPSQNDSAVQVADGIGNNNHGDSAQHNNNFNAIWNITRLGNATQDTVEITFTYSQSSASWDTYLSSADFYNALSNADINFTPTGSTIAVETGEPVGDEEWYQEITLNADNSWKDTINDLPAADADGNTYIYYIEEETVPERYSVSFSDNNEGGVTSGVLTAYNKSDTELGSLHITKTVFKNGVMDAGATGTFYYAIYDEPYDSGADPAQTPIRTGSIQVTAFGAATVTEERLKAGKYYVYELTGPDGTPVISGEEGLVNDGKYYEVTTTGEQAVVNENDPPTVHIINNHRTTSFTANKAWVNDDNNTPLEGASVTLTLYKGETEETAATAVSTIVLNGTADYSGTDHVEGEPENPNAYENAAWHAIWKNLPMYDTDGKRIYYVVRETGTYSGYSVSYEKTKGDEPQNKVYALNKETITNSKSQFQFDILKEEEGTSVPLPGAAFTIQKVKETSNTSSPEYDGDAAASDPAVTGADGRTSFKNVSPGYYEVLEAEPPEGYVLTGDAAFYIKVEPTGIKLLEKEVTGGKLSFKEASTATVGNVTINREGTAVTFTVENIPGAALPNAGGPGTRLIYFLGIILAGFAGLGLVMKKRRKMV